MDIKQTWEKAKKQIADKVSSISFDCWIKPLQPEAFENAGFVLSADSKAGADQALNPRHFVHIEAAIKEIAPIVEKVIIIDAVEKERRDAAGKNTEKVVPVAKTDSASDVTRVNPLMTFDNFIVGKSNEIVAAAAESVAKNPGKRINPLFIYGGVGLGKTHLLNAIANHVLLNTPDMKIALVTCEKFVTDFVTTMTQKDKPTEAFREKYRSVDVLLVDDIQSISGKQGTQEEFYNTFNDLFQNGRQIVLASDRPPDEMATLQERLKSRFKSGIIQDIGSPDVEMRMAILQKKAAQENYHLDDEVISHLSSVAVEQNMNIRDMEGMLRNVVFYAGLMNRPKPTIEDCHAALKTAAEDKKIQTTADHIIEHVCKYFNIAKADLIGKKRNREFVEPRMFAIYLITEFLNIPLVNIGQILGGRDHTTVMHSRNKIQSQLAIDARAKRIASDISKLIKSE
jgi:chromosomal replication initiator protein